MENTSLESTQGAFVWDQTGIRIIGKTRVSVCLGAILIPKYLDFHSGYSAPRSRIAGIYSGIYSYSGISQTNAPSELYGAPFVHLLFRLNLCHFPLIYK